MINSKKNILFISKACSSKTYEEVVSERTKASLDPSQRLFSAVFQGLIQNGCNVTCISIRPFSINNTNKVYFERKTEVIEGVKYIYPSFRISPIKRMHDLYINTRKEVDSWIKDNNDDNSIIICDSLVAMSTIPARKKAMKNGIKTVAYVTDYPTLATSIKGRQKIIKSIAQKCFDLCAARDLSKYDAYILVSEHLKDLIKFRNKPYIVIEDVIITEGFEYKKKEIADKFIILYGGALCERFGVNKLVDTLEYIKNEDIELVFYGSGESVPYIESKSNKDNRIRYGGVLPFDKLQEEQRRADILVNPRPSDEIFSKYSFPSKTLSYMMSGTPVLSTRIPGIPNDYHEYIIWFDDEDVKSMADKISEVSRLSKKELGDKGYLAFEYAKNNKNPIVQGKKIVDFLSEKI